MASLAEEHYTHRVDDLVAYTTTMTWEGSRIDSIVTTMREQVGVEEQVLVSVRNDSLGRQVPRCRHLAVSHLWPRACWGSSDLHWARGLLILSME